MPRLLNVQINRNKNILNINERAILPLLPAADGLVKIIEEVCIYDSLIIIKL